MREVPVYRERLLNPQLVHDDEAQAVDEAVALVPMPGQVGEGLPLLVGRRLMDLPKSPAKIW